jgi:hypothetical protein
MPESLDLTEVIQDSIDDADLGAVDASTDIFDDSPEPIPAEPEEVAPEAPVEAPEAIVDEPATPELAPKPPTQAEDEFSKRFGFPKIAPSGRENKLPHSRVKVMVEKAEKEAREKTLKEFEPQLNEFKTKVQDYEGRLQKVAQFEDIMVNDSQKFLGMLSQLPAYKGFFDHVNKLMSGAQAQPAQQAPVDDGMPQPDLQLPDGSWSYSMEGLKGLLKWQAEQVETKVTSQVTQRYAPIESEWKRQEQLAQLVPQIQAQIEAARKWPGFTESEEDITKALAADPNLSLEGAYRQVHMAKVTADRERIRQEVLAEIRKAPTSTAAPIRSAKPAQPVQTGPRSITDIIQEEVNKLKGL